MSVLSIPVLSITRRGQESGISCWHPYPHGLVVVLSALERVVTQRKNEHPFEWLCQILTGPAGIAGACVRACAICMFCAMWMHMCFCTILCVCAY